MRGYGYRDKGFRAYAFCFSARTATVDGRDRARIDFNDFNGFVAPEVRLAGTAKDTTERAIVCGGSRLVLV